MNIFNNRTIYIVLAVFISLLLAFSFYYFSYVTNEKSKVQLSNYQNQAGRMQSRVAQMIYEKQKATIAIGLVLAEDKEFIRQFKRRAIAKDYYTELVGKFKEETEYKNIWINIVDNKMNSVYRSWTDKKRDSLRKIRADIAEVLKSKKVSYTVSSGKFSVAIKALIPITDKDKVLGVLEVISHFNSIANTLEKFDIDSVVLLNKKHSQRLQYPFSGKFLDGYYVANIEAKQNRLEYLQKHGIENYFITDYKVENGHLITAYPLVSFDGEVLGYYIMFKNLNNISSVGEDFYIFKWVAGGFILILIAAALMNILLLYFVAKQKTYIKNIIDLSTNIVLVQNKRSMLDVNKSFFKYFTEERSLEEFKTKYSCLCDLFVEEEGYVYKYMEGELWIDYILQHPADIHKVKIAYGDKVYYFNVSVSLIAADKGYYSVIFSDVSNEEIYKHELEKLTVTDSLTGIANRRFYNTKIKESISMAKRYKFPLSLISIDIDHFKRVNDKHGHGVGDNVLVEYSKLIKSMIREADTFCRMGGEEFVIIVPYADLQHATNLAEKIRKRVEKHKAVLPITMSFGVTQYIIGEDADHLLTRSDKALYEAKENGRNQVVSL
ncbi:MAG: diguanylate cyclase [Sulfurimonas sp.]